MRYTSTAYQARRHPIVAFLGLLILGPFMLAAALIAFVVLILATLLTLGRT